jgi:hypothetical protein
MSVRPKQDPFRRVSGDPRVQHQLLARRVTELEGTVIILDARVKLLEELVAHLQGT